ncbi:MAG TPA: hypothetical protein VG777_07380 [Thermoanaerobaculia bacterium]|nr:hypothetical protein [Thermoanaerobaculia bacterium]
MAEEIPPPGPPTPELPPPAPPDRTLMLILAYLGPLSLVPILADKEDAEVQWHAKNGLVLFGAWAVVCMIDVFIFATVQIFGCLYTMFMLFVGLLYLALIVVGIAKALRGERLVVPVLTDLARRF